MRHLFLKIYFLGFFLLAFIFASLAFAQLSEKDIVFPVAELGNCADEDECREYCDVLEHQDACFEFAKKYGLLGEGGEIKSVPVGPGGCISEKECRAYCENVSHAEECIAFALENGYMTQEEANQARVQLNRTGPGGCRGQQECRSFCDDPANHEACLEYARKEGLISEKDYNIAKKTGASGGPGGCRSHVECREYCGNEAHLDECLTFAEKEGHISSDEVKRIRKIGVAKGPGGCKFEECKTYCDDPAHQTECISFAEEKGLMSPQEAAMARKMAGKQGPGGCVGRACATYCNDSANGAACLEFAAAEGLMPPQEIERARKFMRITAEGGPGGCKGMECRNYCDDPSHREECFGFAKNQGLLNKEELQQFESGLKIQKVMEEKGGPGGCKTEPECMQYCGDPSHVEECVSFGAAHGGIPEEQVRQMLKQFSEGKFEAHGDFGPRGDFGKFEEESFRRFQEFKQLEDQFRGGGGFSGGAGGFPGGPEGFPGGPGGFPGGMPEGIPRGSGGGFGFQGPGGCNSPSECIKFCTQNPQECFGGPGGPGGPGGFPGHGGGPRQLRPDLLQYVQPSTGGVPEESSGAGESGGAQNIRVRSVSDNVFEFTFQSSGGVREFLLLPARGSHYGGSVPGCDHRFIAETSFSRSAFPIKASLVDCQSGEKYEVELQSPFASPPPPPESSSARPQEQQTQSFPQEFPNQIPPGGIPEGFQIPQGTIPEGFQFPQGGIPEGFQFPEGFQIPEGLIPPGSEIPGSAPESAAPAPPSLSTEHSASNSRSYLKPLPQYGPDKYSIVVEDPEGVKEFGIQGRGGEGLYGGGYNTARPCNDAENLSRPSGTVTIPASYFPLAATVTDCNGQQGFFSVSPPAEAGQAPQKGGFFAGLLESAIRFLSR